MAIQVERLTYRYPEASEPALADVSLVLPEGAFYALIGPSGAGKSSLLASLAGFIPHFYRGRLEGEVRVLGRPTTECAIHEIAEEVGFVFQNPFDQLSGVALTVREEVAFGLENLGLPPAEMGRRVEEALRAVGMLELVGRNPYQLSGGQQQRVALASILAMQAPVLLLDEATGQLDPQGTQEVFETVAGLHRRGRTVLMVEHKMELVARYAQRVLVLHRGRLVAEGTPGEVFADPRLAEWGLRPPVYIPLGQVLAEAGLWSGPLPLTEEAVLEGLR